MPTPVLDDCLSTGCRQEPNHVTAGDKTTTLPVDGSLCKGDSASRYGVAVLTHDLK